jgi:hypothetical protein
MAPKKKPGKYTMKEEHPIKREECDAADYDLGVGDADECKVKHLQPMLTGAEFMAVRVRWLLERGNINSKFH